MRLLLGLLLPAAVAATVTVTPFCKNSVRVQITPSDADSDEDYKQQAAVLAQTLAEKELKELPARSSTPVALVSRWRSPRPRR